MAKRARKPADDEQGGPPPPKPGDGLGWVAPSELVPWARNPRQGQPVKKLMAAIRKLGFGAPVVARPSDKRIITGHSRTRAAIALGLDEIPVRWLELSDEDAATMTLADNRLGDEAAWEPEALGSILSEMDADARLVAGFDDAVVAMLRTDEPRQEAATEMFSSLDGRTVPGAEVVIRCAPAEVAIIDSYLARQLADGVQSGAALAALIEKHGDSEAR